jgi:hypothetical protein
MGVKDRNVIPSSYLAKKVTEVFVSTAINLTNAVILAFTPGQKFQLVRCRSYCRIKNGSVSFVVKVGGRVAVAAGTMTQATEVAQALSATLANLQGSATEAITIEITTDGTGALTDGRIFLEWRARPLDGEAATGEVS